MTSEPIDHWTPLQSLVATSTAAQALAASDTARLDHLLRYLAEAFPTDRADAVRFTQELCNQFTLIRRRTLHGMKEGPLDPGDRVLLAQQEVDYGVMCQLAERLFEHVFNDDFEAAAQAAALPVHPSDTHHPRELDPHDPWNPNRERLAEILDGANVLIAAWEHGDIDGTPLASRHTAMPTLFEVLARRLNTDASESTRETMRLGYALALVRARANGTLHVTANAMLDPKAVLESLERYAADGAAPQGRFVRRLLRVTSEFAAVGMHAAWLEDSLVSPIPAGRSVAD